MRLIWLNLSILLLINLLGTTQAGKRQLTSSSNEQNFGPSSLGPKPRRPIPYFRCDHLKDFKKSPTEEFYSCCRNFPRGSFLCPDLAPAGHVCAGVDPPACCQCTPLPPVPPPKLFEKPLVPKRKRPKPQKPVHDQNSEEEEDDQEDEDVQEEDEYDEEDED